MKAEKVLDAIIELIDPDCVLQNYENLLIEIQHLVEMRKNEIS